MRTTGTASRPFLVTGALTAALALGLTACGTGGGETTSDSPSSPATSSAPASSSASATPTPSPSASVSSAASSSASPSASSSASSSATPSSSSSAPQAAGEATLYWVTSDLDAPGAVGFESCGDSALMPAQVPVTGAGAPGEESFVQAALEALLAEDAAEIGSTGLTNSLHHSELTVEDVSIDGGTVTVDLLGLPVSNGTCDTPRIWSQLEETARVNAQTQKAQILVEGTPIREFMSEAG